MSSKLETTRCRLEAQGYLGLSDAELVVAAASPTFTDFCIPSFFYGLMFGKPEAPPPATP